MTVYNAAGTRITKATFPATADSDPLMVVDETLYERVRYGDQDADAEGSLTKVLVPQGTVLRQSQIDRMFPAATIAAITPDTGGTAGGDTVTITGTNLDGVSGVTFDGIAGTNLTVVSPTELTVDTPAHAAGAVDVVVTDDSGPVTETGGFTYA